MAELTSLKAQYIMSQPPTKSDFSSQTEAPFSSSSSSQSGYSPVVTHIPGTSLHLICLLPLVFSLHLLWCLMPNPNAAPSLTGTSLLTSLDGYPGQVTSLTHITG